MADMSAAGKLSFRPECTCRTQSLASKLLLRSRGWGARPAAAAPANASDLGFSRSWARPRRLPVIAPTPPAVHRPAPGEVVAAAAAALGVAVYCSDQELEAAWRTKCDHLTAQEIRRSDGESATARQPCHPGTAGGHKYGRKFARSRFLNLAYMVLQEHRNSTHRPRSTQEGRRPPNVAREFGAIMVATAGGQSSSKRVESSRRCWRASRNDMRRSPSTTPQH